MDLRRLRAGEWIAGVSGVVLGVALFLPWYERREPLPAQRTTMNAWEAYATVDVLLAITAALGIGLLLLTAAQRSPSPGIAADALVTIVASPIALVALVRVLVVPEDFEAAAPLIEAGRAGFAWIGLGAAIGVAVGAIVAMRDERPSRPGRPTDATGVPLDGQPEIERLPAPPVAS